MTKIDRLMSFLIRRLSFYFIAFLAAITFNFLLPRMMPGDPVEFMLSQANLVMDEVAYDALKKTLGFVDGPLWEQYLAYIKSVFTLDLGTSTKFFPSPVSNLLSGAFIWTIFLAGSATLISFSLGSFLGIFASWKRGGWFDSIFSPTIMIFQSFPAIVVSLLCLYGLAIALKWFPTGYAYDPALDPSFSWEFISSVLYHVALPLGSLVVVQTGGFWISMRNNMINLLGEDYITMAKAKGLGTLRVIFNYAARNALLPSITALSMSIGFILSGAMITELIFNYPGLGFMLFEAIVGRDYPLIQGQLLLITATMLFANFTADLLYVFVDPRLRTGEVTK